MVRVEGGLWTLLIDNAASSDFDETQELWFQLFFAYVCKKNMKKNMFWFAVRINSRQLIGKSAAKPYAQRLHHGVIHAYK